MHCGEAEEVGRVMTKVLQRCIGLDTPEVGKREREEIYTVRELMTSGD